MPPLAATLALYPTPTMPPARGEVVEMVRAELVTIDKDFDVDA